MTKEREEEKGEEQRLEEHRQGLQESYDQSKRAGNKGNKGNNKNQVSEEPYFPEIYLG
jgi:hypothetical protein